MRWQGRRQSSNVEDRRGIPVKGMAAGGGGLLFLAVIVISVLTGRDPRQALDMVGQLTEPGSSVRPSPEQDELAAFVSVVLADTEAVWGKIFADAGKAYREPTLVLFTGHAESACGFQSAAVGPFYCPGDQKVYIDLAFYGEMKERLGAPGDFAQAYVIAHEIGHHVQNLLGASGRAHEARGRGGREDANQLSVRIELQADYFAGVWAHHAEQNWRILEEGDIEEALNAASAIGDDRLQMESQGYVVPESFSHGTSRQRVRWFRKGLESGKMDGGDTFSAPYEKL